MRGEFTMSNKCRKQSIVPVAQIVQEMIAADGSCVVLHWDGAGSVTVCTFPLMATQPKTIWTNGVTIKLNMSSKNSVESNKP